MLGRPNESARLGEVGLEVIGRYRMDNTVLVSNYIEALVAIGEWERADSVSAAALRALAANYPYMLLMNRAEIEIGRGRFDQARAHLDAARRTLREDTRARDLRRVPRRVGAVGVPVGGRRQGRRRRTCDCAH